jgi:acyl-CoA synthetase (AMP-forming)/AMP-acid ligase II
MTELTNGVCYLDAAHQRTKVGSQGAPFPHTDVAIVDSDGRPLPAGSVGEIVVRGPKVTLGYWRDPQATAAAWRDGWFHTGDMGYLDDDGYLWFVDRQKDMIKSGGENIASAEIERVLAAHPGVDEVAVIGVPDPRWDEVPKAFVVARAGHTLTAEDLRAFCEQHLGRFKVPKHFAIVPTLPRNDSGKVLKRILREQEASPDA